MKPLPINEFKIAQFRGLRDLVLQDCGRINLLVGGNNSGKTSVLDAVSLFCRPLDIGNWREVAWRREVKSARTPLTEPFKWLFPQFLESDLPDPRAIWLHGRGGFPGRRLMAQYSEFESFGDQPQEETSDRAEREEEEESEVETGLEIRVFADFAHEIGGRLDDSRIGQNPVEFKVIDNQRFTYSTRVEWPFAEVGFISPVTHRTTQDTTHYLSQALRNERPGDDVRASLTEVMREIDPGVEKFEIVETGRTTSTILIKHRETGMSPISAFGDGMRRALLIAATIPAAAGGVLLIDEIETALHHTVFQTVMRALKSAAERYDVQVFATTHSLEAVDAVARVYEKDLGQLAGYHLERTAMGVDVTRYAGDLMHRLRFERGLELR